MIVVKCPHCHLLVQIESVNCAIFRHAILKDSYTQVPPHAPKEVCDRLIEEGKVIGCCKPFRVRLGEDGTYSPEMCEYI